MIKRKVYLPKLFGKYKNSLAHILVLGFYWILVVICLKCFKKERVDENLGVDENDSTSGTTETMKISRVLIPRT